MLNLTQLKRRAMARRFNIPRLYFKAKHQKKSQELRVIAPPLKPNLMHNQLS
jgi:hypothetical protein